MKLIKSHFQNIFLSLHFLTTVTIGISIVEIISTSTSLKINLYGILLYLSGIFSAYSLDRIIDQRGSIYANKIKLFLTVGFILATLIGFYSSLKLPLQFLTVIFICASASIFYYQLKKVFLLKNFLVAGIWVFAGVTLPFSNFSYTSLNFELFLLITGLFFLFTAGGILCDIKDFKTDSEDFVLSFPVIFGEAISIKIAVLFILISSVLFFMSNNFASLFASILLLIISFLPKLLLKKNTAPFIVDLILSLPGLILLDTTGI